MSEQNLLKRAEDIGAKRVWGEKSLNLGELAGFIIGAWLIIRPPKQIAKYGKPLGLLIIFVCTAIF